jgi:hypothetical protein
MRNIGRTVPVALAVGFGVLTLLGILYVPELGSALMTWASFLAAVALLLGVINLLLVHLRRVSKGNVYSGVLVFSMVAIFVLAVTDYFGFTNEGVTGAFNLVQAPLEAAVASLLSFFLIFAGFRLLQRQRNGWGILFIVTAIIILLGSTMLPDVLSSIFGRLSEFLSDIFVSAGMRGLLIGISLGAITVALRLLMGSERPYDR